MKALAFSNNDIVVIAWTYDRRLKGCKGFAVYRCDSDGSNPVALPALARFDGMDTKQKLTTEQAPIQKFWWKDLFAERGREHSYRIVPMGGAPGALEPLADCEPLQTNSVKLTPDRGKFKAYFNRGIVASQAVSREMKGKGLNVFRQRIGDPKDPLRVMLAGQLYEGVTSLLDRLDATEDATVLAALYELGDPEGLERRLQAADHGSPKARHVILGNEWGVDAKTKEPIRDLCADARKGLKNAGVPVIDRMVPRGQIPHNKFMVLKEGEQPVLALTGSTNWTSNGLCSQTNNCLVIDSKRVAEAFAAYWDQLRRDTEAAHGDDKELQSDALRDWDHANNAEMIKAPIELEDGSGLVELFFSPNTPGLLGKHPKPPNDMARLFELVGKAKKAVLFLAFDPGNNSILDAAGKALHDNPDLFVRGALTNAVRAENFKEALDGPGDQVPGPGGFEVAVIAESGKSKKSAKPAEDEDEKNPPEVDYRAVPAGAVGADDIFGAWEKEMYKAGYAIIHNKIVVIDPFDDDCVVCLGSHNLGYRASHNNDENMIIVRGHKALAQAYACHVLDLYDHYAWRYWLHKMPGKFGKPLMNGDGWQDRYIDGENEKAPELRFWLGA